MTKLLAPHPLAKPLPRRAALFAVAGAGLLAACGGGDDAPHTVVDVLASDSSTQILVEALNEARLTDTLRNSSALTVFAPTDSAFAALLTELNLSKAQLFADKPLLTAVLNYHVLSSRVLRAQVPAGRPITPLAGGIFKVDAVGNELIVIDGRNRNARITTTDLQGSNGVVHKIDRVLLPANRTIVQTAQGNASFSILVEALVAADLVSALSAPGPLTVFAPTNTAFANLLTELNLSKDQLLANKPLLTQVLSYHVLATRVLKAEVPVATPVSTLQGEALTVDANLQISDRNARRAAITTTDLLCSNGVIHVIDRVILPKLPNLVEFALARPEFSILVEAVTAAGLASTLSGPTALTLFAPTNDAFAALLTELRLTKAALLADTTLLISVLTYHVVPGRVYRAGVPIGAPITTLGGGQFSVDAQLSITDARGRRAGISATDGLALNGVVHTLDRVILPAP